MKKYLIFLFAGLAVLASCRPKDQESPSELRPYTLPTHAFLGQPVIPADNPLTVEGIGLGRRLFHDPILSIDGSKSCASCHNPSNSFAESLPVSIGVSGAQGDKNAMALVNLAWQNKFFWDGRAPSLEDQALGPIQNPKEMALSLPEMEQRLNANPGYVNEFKRVFGTNSITAAHVAKAIAQYERSLVSIDTKYDLYLRGQYTPTARELNAMNLFFRHPVPANNFRGGNCGDCHLQGNLAGNQDGFLGFHNNGLSLDSIYNSDAGLFNVTQKPSDKGRFKTPSLRNIALTAPYMHDGRFRTLEEVMDHYNNPQIFNAKNVDVLIKEGTNFPSIGGRPIQPGLGLTQQEKDEIVFFLKEMMTDTVFLSRNRPR